MSKKATIIAVVNQKGGTGKTTTTENLGVGLALEGKKVLLVDTDPQASLTVSLGNPCPDDLSPTLSDLMGKIMLADFLDMESTQIVTMHIQSVDQTAAIKTIKRTITELDRSKIEEQKKAVRSGYDMDISATRS